MIELPRRSRSYFLASTAVLSALAIIAEVIPSFRVFWGMKIDFVGVAWVLAFFLYGTAEALYVSIIATIFILGYSPTTFVGATMKFIATIPMFLIPAALQRLPPLSSGKSSKVFNRVLVISTTGFLAILVRVIASSIANYYWAIPLFLGIPSDVVLQTRFGNSIWAFLVFVASMNVLQGMIDILAPWFLAFRLGLCEHFGTW
jgi:riboflavin transporter FmnP